MKESRPDRRHISGPWANSSSWGKHLWNHTSVDLLWDHAWLLVKLLVNSTGFTPGKGIFFAEEVVNGTPCTAAVQHWGFRLASLSLTQYHYDYTRQTVCYSHDMKLAVNANKTIITIRHGRNDLTKDNFRLNLHSFKRDFKYFWGLGDKCLFGKLMFWYFKVEASRLRDLMWVCWPTSGVLPFHRGFC